MTNEDPDAWWAHLTPERREQIHRWVAAPHTAPPDLPGQLSIADLPPEIPRPDVKRVQADKPKRGGF